MSDSINDALKNKDISAMALDIHKEALSQGLDISTLIFTRTVSVSGEIRCVAVDVDAALVCVR